MPKRIDQPIRNEICDLYKKGITSPKLATQFNITVAGVCKILKEQDVPRNNYFGKIKAAHNVIIQKYLSGNTTYMLGKEYDVDPSTIREILIQHDIKRRSSDHKTSFCKEAIVNDYVAHRKIREIADKYSVSTVTVYRVLSRNNISVGDTERLRTYTIDETVFERPLTADAAQWVGFLMADGCVTDQGGILVSQISPNRNHIELLRRFLKTNCPIAVQTKNTSKPRGLNIIKKHDLCLLSVYSKKIASDLSKHGVVPRKSKTAKALNGIDKIPAFWAGCINGDGWCLMPNSLPCKPSPCPVIGLGGSKNLIEQFQGFIQTNIPGCRSSVLPHSSIYRLVVSGRYASELANLVFAPGVPVLPTKQENVQLIKKWVGHHCKLSKLSDYCSVKGCNGKYYASRMCCAHYHRQHSVRRDLSLILRHHARLGSWQAVQQYLGITDEELESLWEQIPS